MLKEKKRGKDAFKFFRWDKSKLPPNPEIFSPVRLHENGKLAHDSTFPNYQERPCVTGLIGVKERRFRAPLPGKIIQKSIWSDKIIEVTILGEYGALYSYSDGIDRFSEMYYIVRKEDHATEIKVLASKVSLVCEN